MFTQNDNFLKLPGKYLFSEIARLVSEHKAAHPQEEVISLGIGDVTQPLSPTVIAALHKAVDEMAVPSTFRGYGPEQGYDFLALKIIDKLYRSRGIEIERSEIFISDGSKSDTGNFAEIIGPDNIIAVADPTFPVYVDTNVMAGRAGEYLGEGRWSRIVYLDCTPENGFVPSLPEQPVDVIYLCYPNNPTGTVLNKTQLKKWVDYAIEHQAIILYDAAYEAYIVEEDVPHSIYEIEGAKSVAIEFRSFSKLAGFTGTRCGFTVVPKALKDLNAIWNRRHTTKFNGTPYIIQRAAEAVLSDQGWVETQKLVAGYMANAKAIRTCLTDLGLDCYGGVNAPYIWTKTPQNMGSWDFFHYLLQNAHVVCTPGVGFGPCGEGFVRFTAFGDPQKTKIALERIQKLLK